MDVWIVLGESPSCRIPQSQWSGREHKLQAAPTNTALPAGNGAPVLSEALRKKRKQGELLSSLSVCQLRPVPVSTCVGCPHPRPHPNPLPDPYPHHPRHPYPPHHLFFASSGSGVGGSEALGLETKERTLGLGYLYVADGSIVLGSLTEVRGSGRIQR